MAVIAVWKCDRDGSMFDDKKTADAHDKMLELAENIAHLIEMNVKSVSEDDAEAIGLLLAKRSEDLVKACKGKPEALIASSSAEPVTEKSDNQVGDASNVTAISAS